MRSPKFVLELSSTVVILAATLFASAPRALAQQESVLHSFNPSSKEGLNPQGNLVRDAAGNLYGTASEGGIYGSYRNIYNCGTVFELSPKAGGGWTEKTLHNFGHGTDGSSPIAGLVFDASGNLYGTTIRGGTYGYGTVFELSPTRQGTWTEKVLHNFNYDGTDGASPAAGLIIDGAGNLYGTTASGGSFTSGTVFELSPNADGSWTDKILHSFAYPTTISDGYDPTSGVVADAAGNLYGTTWGGGYYSFGMAFELSPAADGTWTEKILHTFNSDGTDGWQSYNGVILDAAGNLYGTTIYGGAYNAGVVFELHPLPNGKWAEKILHNFNGDGTDGVQPLAGLIFDAGGNLYGTAHIGGSGYGVVFELSPSKGGTWTETILHDFQNNGADGENPEGGVVLDLAGNIYGTTYSGGAFGDGYYGNINGAVFEITP